MTSLSETEAFTPGPWHIVSEREDELKVKGPGDEWVADCADGFWSDEADGWVMAAESEANARLIAEARTFADIAARIQYRANGCGGDYDDIPRDELNAFMSELDAALTRARGEK